MSATMSDTNRRPFTVNDEAAWQAYFDRNSDPYSRAAVNYAARWMAMMEADADEFGIDDTLAQRADRLSHRADTDGISGYMHAAAARGIAQFWKYGEEFRRWFNRKNQIGDEGDRANQSGGILNPAVLHVCLQNPKTDGG